MISQTATMPQPSRAHLHGQPVGELTDLVGGPRACPGCGHQDAAPHDVPMHCCTRCGLLHRPHTLAFEELAYWDGYIENDTERSYNRRRQAYCRAFWRVARRLPRARRNGRPRVLDVGCVPGQFLAEAHADGWITHGVELSAELCRLTADHCPAILWQGHLESIDFGVQRFDLIVLSEMLRHTTAPRAVLQKAASLLRPGGAVVVRELDAEHPRSAGRRACPYLFDMQLFTPASLTELMSRSGLVECRATPSPVSLLTTGLGSRVVDRHPRTYRMGLAAVNAAIGLAGRLPESVRPRMRSFLGLGYAPHRRGGAA